MYRNILLPTDGSELSKMALREGVDLAKALSAKVTAVTVTAPFDYLNTNPIGLVNVKTLKTEYDKNRAAVAAQYLDAAKTIAAVAGVPCTAVHCEDEQPYRAIIATAEDKGCDAILMASHGRRGISAFLLGSETLKVLAHSILPVIVYRQPRITVGEAMAGS